MKDFAQEIEYLIGQFKRWGFGAHSYPNPIGMVRQEWMGLLWAALNSDRSKDFIEIGSFFGGSAVLLCLAKHCKSDNLAEILNNQSKVYSVDISFYDPEFPDNCEPHSESWFDKNLEVFKDTSRKIPTNSINLPSKLEKLDPKPEFSLAFIDGWHSMRGAYTDYLSVEPYLTSDAIVCFHDTPSYIPENTMEELYQDAKANFDQYMNDPTFTRRGTAPEQDYKIDRAISVIVKEHGFTNVKCPLFQPKESALTVLKRNS